MPFCYDNGKSESELSTNAEHLSFLQGSTREYLDEHTIGIDRGVAIPVHAGFQRFNFSDNQKKSMSKSERYIKRQQRRLAKQQKGSNRRSKTKHRIANHHAKKANVRNDFAHKTSLSLVNSNAKVIACEGLRTSNMIRKPKASKMNKAGLYQTKPNQTKQKAGY